MSTDSQYRGNTTTLLVMLAFSAFLIGLGSFVISPLIPALARSIHFSLEKGGWLVAAYSLFYAATAPFLGPISDRWGRKNMMLAGIFVFGLGNLLTASWNTFSLLLLSRGIAGVGGAMVMPSVYALIGDAIPYEKRGKAMGIVMGAVASAIVLGIPLGSVFAELGSWRATFLTVVLLSLLLFLAILMILPKESPQKGASHSLVSSYLNQLRSALHNASARFALLSTFFWWAGFQGMFAVLGIYYYQNFQVSINVIGFIFSLAGLSNIAGSIVGGRLSDRLGKRALVRIACLLSAAGVLFLPLFPSAFIFAIAMHIVYSFAVGIGQAPLNTLISELDPRVRATILSLTSSTMYLGMTAASAAGTLLLQFGSFAHIGIMCALSFLLVWGIVNKLVHGQTRSGMESNG